MNVIPINNSVTVLPDYIYKHLMAKAPDVFRTEKSGDLFESSDISLEDLGTIVYLNIADFKEFGAVPLQIGISSETNKLFGNKALSEHSDKRRENAARFSSSSACIDRVRNLLLSVSNETSPTYEFLVLGNKTWLVVKNGFLNTLTDSNKRMIFLRDYLKNFGKAATFETVVSTNIYSAYVEELLG